MPELSYTPAPLGLLDRRWPERRRVVIAAALGLLAGVIAGLVLADDASLGLAFLAVVPIVLVALECGQRAGLAVALAALAAVVLLAAFGRPELTAAAIATRAGAYLAAGLAAGRFSDRMRAAHASEERLLRSGLRLSEAARPERLAEIALSELMGTPGVLGASVGIDGVTELRTGLADGARTVVPMVAHGVHVGTIEVFRERPPAAEELAALKLLARQTAIVAESLRLLDLDEERAALETRMRELRRELLQSRSGAGLLLRAEERGKREMAEKLHEDLAQVLSAVLLGMRMLDRSRPGDGSATLASLHEQVARVLAEVRDVARALRPVVLDQLGLAAALEALGREAQVRGSRARLAVGGLPRALSGDAETAVFRLVEAALAMDAEVSVAAAGDALHVDIDLEAPAPESVLTLRARAESGGGSLVTLPDAGGVTAFRATMPAV